LLFIFLHKNSIIEREKRRLGEKDLERENFLDIFFKLSKEVLCFVHVVRGSSFHNFVAVVELDPSP